MTSGGQLIRPKPPKGGATLYGDFVGRLAGIDRATSDLIAEYHASRQRRVLQRWRLGDRGHGTEQPDGPRLQHHGPQPPGSARRAEGPPSGHRVSRWMASSSER